ncbi:sarcosine oxidase subunit gamma [Jannaschia faecimaris]|uniref:Sarcosine oxidase subunit gamma n=1 Tax=Jannaschia faecimaris TaxID=1244108 RepID=A0A1H3SQG0_9RHOB|nr:sarcosine oxidase subunit gamma [Jannaschia faecimaris]SDZ39791.1 sarcosine oxidase subunit gamma [Jannaschia faecimaris]
MSDISIAALPPMGMITLRGDIDKLNCAVEMVTGCDAPARRMSTRSGDITSMWMSPDELLVVCGYKAAQDIARRIDAELSNDFATVSIVSDARQVYDIKGFGCEDLLAALMPVDFVRLGATEVRRTRMAQIPAAIWRHSDGFHLICFRSVAEYARDLLENAKLARG